MDDKELGLWLKRADVVGRAQERYLWLLLIAGVFFFALDAPGSQSTGAVTIPILNVPLRPDVVWASGPFVLGFLLVAAMGSLRAYRTIEDALKAARVEFGEAFDSAPNALDFAFYTTPESPLLLRKVFLFVYPTYFGLFLVEAAYLLVGQARPFLTMPEHPFLAATGLVASSWGGIRVGRYWVRNWRRARELR